ncbi:MAG: hypothetical protein CMP98_15835 [Gammaproteobacteria bacterium]|nr:hypothetical protein [Gammaproteobacteria bacterium]|tara:strand:+ start:435 stop:656 length:222 start_codon:yes stop_codon:yes gene_type:complete
MTPEEIYEIAEDFNFIVTHDDDGSIVLVTGVIDETKRQAEPGDLDDYNEVDRFMDELNDFDDEDDYIYDSEED